MSRAARATSLPGLFADDPVRSETLLFAGPHMALDLSLRFVTPAMTALLPEVMVESGVASLRSAMFAGEAVNSTEGRPATHAVERTGRHLEAMLETARAIRDGGILPGGRRAATLVNIGIGGSHLGPAMVHRALAGFVDGPEVRFVSNVDPVALEGALEGVDLATAVFAVSSKTFTTPETLSNAERVRSLLVAAGLDPTAHFVAVTAAPDRARRWGIDEAAIVSYSEAIGGRFSVSGPVGLPVAVAIGPERFRRFVGAMADMDRHFADAPAEANLPVLHAVASALEATELGHRSLAVIAYAERLGLLALYLQQLMMESNGKSVDRDGAEVRSTGPAVWGGVGTDAQHAYFQWLHQGTDPTPTDIVIVGDTAPSSRDDASREAARMLVANALAQGEVLAFGDGARGGDPDTNPHRHLPGNRSSTRILLKELSPETVGALVAFYEHTTVVQAWLWGINPFDQFGVEHGKAVAREIGASRIDDADDVGTRRWSVASRWLFDD